VSTVAVAWLSIFCIKRRVVSAERLVTIVIYGAFTVSVTKLAIAIGSLYFGVNPVDVTLSIFQGAPIISGPMPLGLQRMEFTPDILNSFALFALLAPRLSGARVGRLMSGVITIAILMSGLLAFSRYIWFSHAAAIATALILRRGWRILAVTCVAALVLGVGFYDFFSAAFESRFLSVSAEKSDSARVEQSRVLTEEFESHPILGKGMGAHAAGLLRDDRDEHLYVYELEWLAFLMQFGIVGMVGIFLLILCCCKDLIMARHPAAPYLWVMFLIWLFSGFTNPYLTSSYAGGAFGLFMAMFYRSRYVVAQLR
jgi:hypothetical protein